MSTPLAHDDEGAEGCVRGDGGCGSRVARDNFAGIELDARGFVVRRFSFLDKLAG